MARHDVGLEVEKMLNDLQLMDKKKTAAKNLSGGMKRKLRYIMCTLNINSAPRGLTLQAVSIVHLR